MDPSISVKYKRWRGVRKSKEPLIILIGGSSGVGTSSMAFELANHLGLKNIISTDDANKYIKFYISG